MYSEFDGKPQADLSGDAASSDLIDHVREAAEKRMLPNVDEGIQLIGAWLLRETHQAVRRAHEMMADGIPPDTAFFTATDDMGFQLALAYVATLQ